MELNCRAVSPSSMNRRLAFERRTPLERSVEPAEVAAEAVGEESEELPRGLVQAEPGVHGGLLCPGTSHQRHLAILMCHPMSHHPAFCSKKKANGS